LLEVLRQFATVAAVAAKEMSIPFLAGNREAVTGLDDHGSFLTPPMAWGNAARDNFLEIQNRKLRLTDWPGFTQANGRTMVDRQVA